MHFSRIFNFFPLLIHFFFIFTALISKEIPFGNGRTLSLFRGGFQVLATWKLLFAAAYSQN